MDDEHNMYTGKITKKRIKKKTAINIKSLVLWYVGILVSFIPVAIDVVAYLANNSLDRGYWIRVCLRGDILWVLATIIVLSVIDYVSDIDKSNKGTFKQVC